MLPPCLSRILSATIGLDDDYKVRKILIGAMELLRYLPATNGMAFVIVQHLDPHHGSELSKLLGKTTAMPVIELAETAWPRPNTVYVQPPNKCVILKGGALKLIRRTEKLNPRSTIFLNRWQKSVAGARSA
jgi:hypothetical protein